MILKNSNKQFKNKRGVVLAFVIIIGAALFILVGMAALLANSSIRVTADAVESRQAYLNAKSGIEFAKVMMDQQVEVTTSLLNASPGAIETLPSTETLHAFGYPDTGFTTGVDLDAPVQIICEIRNEKTVLASTTPGVIQYDYNMVINAVAEAKLDIASNDPGMPNSIKLKYQDVEPLNGSIILGDGTISDEVIPEGTVFDANISGDLLPYLNDTTLKMYSVGSSASNHSIVYTKTITNLAANTIIQTANKIYFLASPNSIDINWVNDNRDKVINLESDYVYFKGNLIFELGTQNGAFYINDYNAGKSIVHFDNVTLTVIRQGEVSTSVELNGFYSFSGVNNYLFKVTNNSFPFPTFTKIADEQSARANFDPYIISSNVSLPVSAAVNYVWTENRQDTNNYLKAPSTQRPDDLVLVLAKRVESNITLNYTGKQIRFVSTTLNNPADEFVVKNNTKITFNTSLLSYYGDEISDGNVHSSLKLNALSGDVAAIYLPLSTEIDDNDFTNSGYYILPSGVDLLGSSVISNVNDNSTSAQSFDTEVISFYGGSDDIFLFRNRSFLSEDVNCVNINASQINFGVSGTPSIVFESLSNKPIYFFFARDTDIEQKDGSFEEFKAGFYQFKEPGQITTVDLTDNPNLVRIAPIFSYPGLEDGQGSTTSSFTMTPASMGGIYR